MLVEKSSGLVHSKYNYNENFESVYSLFSILKYYNNRDSENNATAVQRDNYDFEK